MNVSTKVKYIWWASMRCGSRSVSEIMKCYDFINYETGQDVRYYSFSHSCDVPAEYLNYKIVMQIRNPYSRALSFWHLYSWKDVNNELVIKNSFEDYVNNDGMITDHYELPAKQFKPAYFIRYENLNEDILNVPFVDMKQEETALWYKDCILKNPYKNEGIEAPVGALARDSKDERYADWRKYFNQDIADIVYEKCKEQFTLFNYNKDSWKI